MSENDRILFSKKNIGSHIIKNRFVRSATYESAASEDGSVGKDYINIYKRLAKGNIGLIITGMIAISDDGKSYAKQAGLHNDHVIDRFLSLTDTVKTQGSAIFAQICHGGRQSQINGFRPKAPSITIPDMTYKVYPREMTHQDILSVIRDFGDAAERAKQAGFDGIQIHAAHGYLINEFLSPFFNRRKDEWGGTSLKRFRILEEVYLCIREKVGPDYPVIVKMNIQDYTPKIDLSMEEFGVYIERLIELGIDGIEISCGTLAFSMFNQLRGHVPAQGMAKTMAKPFRPLARYLLKKIYPEEKIGFEENYNLWASNYIKKIMKDTPLILVGGIRRYKSMEKIINEHAADFISISRPFIREPMMLNKWMTGDIKPFSCANCNNCLAGVALHEQLKCNQNRRF